MTNGWIDIKNTDMMLIMGGNPAENHPCGFKWAVEAKRQRNAKMIVVDPRFTRTAALADQFVQLRAGSDIAFLGGLIRYAIENNRIAREYLLHYTNAAFLVKEGFKLPEDGLYSGYDAAAHAYDKATWNYEGVGEGKPGSAPDLPAVPAYDITLEHPRSVFQLLKRHYSRYTPEMVERITGVPKVEFLKVADLFTSIRKDGDMKKAGTIIYAVGWTQHSSGTQTIAGSAVPPWRSAWSIGSSRLRTATCSLPAWRSTRPTCIGSLRCWAARPRRVSGIPSWPWCFWRPSPGC